MGTDDKSKTPATESLAGSLAAYANVVVPDEDWHRLREEAWRIAAEARERPFLRKQ